MSFSYEMLLKGVSASDGRNAGLGMNLLGTYLADQANRWGTRSEQNQLELAMQQNALASTQQAIANEERLHYTLGMQRAIAASRGQELGQGSVRASQQYSLREAATEERNRESTLTSAKAQTKQMKSALGIQRAAKSQSAWGGLLKSATETISLNQMMGDYLNPTKGPK